MGVGETSHARVWHGGAFHLRSEASARKRPGFHAHFAIQLIVSYDGPLLLRTNPGKPVSVAPGWLLGSEQPHLLQSSGKTAVILADPLVDTGCLLASRLRGAGFVSLSDTEREAVLSELDCCRQSNFDGPTIRASIRRIAHLLAPAACPLSAMDWRVRAVLDDLISKPDESVSLAVFAAKAGLSESRLAHLFRKHVGLPIRQYRLSLRAESAILQIAAGCSVTEAAYAAGFSDSAHFCRTCRRMFGIAPSQFPNFEAEYESRLSGNCTRGTPSLA